MKEVLAGKLNDLIFVNIPDPLRTKAEEARKIILSDFSIYESVEEIARKVGTTEQKLQMKFKQLYGTTVGKFSRQERLQKAQDILLNGDDILLSVALATGYNDVSNFSTAFKQYFGYSPGQIQKTLRKYHNSALEICAE